MQYAEPQQREGGPPVCSVQARVGGSAPVCAQGQTRTLTWCPAVSALLFFSVLIVFSVKLTFGIISYWFQGYGIVVRYPHASGSDPYYSRPPNSPQLQQQHGPHRLLLCLLVMCQPFLFLDPCERAVGPLAECVFRGWVWAASSAFPERRCQVTSTHRPCGALPPRRTLQRRTFSTAASLLVSNNLSL